LARLLIYEHLTGGGMAGEPLQESWLAEGRAMRKSAMNAFRQAGCEVVTLQDARLPVDYDNEFVPIRHKSDLRPTLLQMIDLTDQGLLIAPETDGSLAEVVALAQTKPGWHLGCDLESVRLFGDKWQTAGFFHDQQIRHPKTWMISNIYDWNLLSYPVVIKPRDGAGSLETFKCDKPIADDFYIKLNQINMIVQEYCEGRSMSLSALCDGRGGFTPVAVFDHNRHSMPAGDCIWEFEYSQASIMPHSFCDQLKECGKALRSAPGLRGWVGVDFIWNSETHMDTVIEINPRLTMSFDWLDQLSGRGGEVARDWLYQVDQSRYV